MDSYMMPMKPDNFNIKDLAKVLVVVIIVLVLLYGLTRGFSSLLFGEKITAANIEDYIEISGTAWLTDGGYSEGRGFYSSGIATITFTNLRSCTYNNLEIKMRLDFIDPWEDQTVTVKLPSTGNKSETITFYANDTLLTPSFSDWIIDIISASGTAVK